jgi:hypothetical protein
MKPDQRGGHVPSGGLVGGGDSPCPVAELRELSLFLDRGWSYG